MSRRIGAYLRRHHLVLILIFVALGGTALAAGERGLTSDTINACVKKKSKPIAWNQQGPQGPQGAAGANGANGADGAQGPAGTAVAYGRVNSDGTLTQSSGVSGVSTPQTGVYCINVPGVNPSTRAIVAAAEYNNSGFQNGSAHWNGINNFGDDPMSGGGQYAFVQWDAIPNFCSAGTYEVRANHYAADATGNDIDIEPHNSSFSFIVP